MSSNQYEVEVYVSPWFDTARNGSTYDLKVLIEGGCNVNAQGAGGMTAGHIAADNGDASKLKMLLDKGLNITIEDEDGQTVSQIIAYREPGKIKSALQQVLDEWEWCTSQQNIQRMLAEAIASEAAVTLAASSPSAPSGGGVQALQTVLHDSAIAAMPEVKEEGKRTSVGSDSETSAKSTSRLHYEQDSTDSTPPLSPNL